MFETISKKSGPGDLGRGIFEPGSKKSAPGTGQGIFETGYGDTIFEQDHFEVLGQIFMGDASYHLRSRERYPHTVISSIF